MAKDSARYPPTWHQPSHTACIYSPYRIFLPLLVWKKKKLVYLLTSSGKSRVIIPASKMDPVKLHTGFTPCWIQTGLCDKKNSEADGIYGFAGQNGKCSVAPTASYSLVWLVTLNALVVLYGNEPRPPATRQHQHVSHVSGHLASWSFCSWDNLFPLTNASWRTPPSQLPS